MSLLSSSSRNGRGWEFEDSGRKHMNEGLLLLLSLFGIGCFLFVLTKLDAWRRRKTKMVVEATVLKHVCVPSFTCWFGGGGGYGANPCLTTFPSFWGLLFKIDKEEIWIPVDDKTAKIFDGEKVLVVLAHTISSSNEVVLTSGFVVLQVNGQDILRSQSDLLSRMEDHLKQNELV